MALPEKARFAAVEHGPPRGGPRPVAGSRIGTRPRYRSGDRESKRVHQVQRQAL